MPTQLIENVVSMRIAGHVAIKGLELVGQTAKQKKNKEKEVTLCQEKNPKK